jgi:hypothetical protein
MVILELIHAQTPDFSEGWHSLVNRPNHLLVLLVIIMTERIAFLRQFVRASDLSAPVGRVLAYRGCDG